jgi:hypothetical protein
MVHGLLAFGIVPLFAKVVRLNVDMAAGRHRQPAGGGRQTG